MTVNEIAKRLVDSAMLTCPGLERDYDVEMLEKVFACVIDGVTEEMLTRQRNLPF